MALRAGLIVVALAEGGFMLLDGSRNVLTGTYFGGGRLGPWSQVVSLAGLDPGHFGAAFMLLGLAWFLALTGLLMRTRWSWWVGLAVAVFTLWYLPLGTAFSLVWIGLLVWRRPDLVPAAHRPDPSR